MTEMERTYDAITGGNGKNWRLINMKVPKEVLERIDAEAKRLRLSRTGYILWRSDPKDTAA